MMMQMAWSDHNRSDGIRGWSYRDRVSEISWKQGKCPGAL